MTRVPRRRAGRALGGMISPHTALSVVVVLVWFATTAAPAAAQDDEEFVNWAFATWIGTGVYRVEDRRLTIFRIPIAVPLPALKDGKWKVKLLLPITLGVTEFDFDIDNPQLPDRVEGFTFIPGAEVAVPMRDNWTLKPFAQIGFGKLFGGGDPALIYGAGLKSLASWPWRRYTFSFGARVMGAGQDVDDNNKGFALFEVGLDTRLPGQIKIRGHGYDFSVFAIFTRFSDDVDFVAPPGEQPVELKRMTHVGFTIGPKEPFAIWRFDIPRVGLGYMHGDAGFNGIRFNAGFAF
ncbi:MAG: hypothetical protein ACE5LB_03955 [Acidiferrobacterales bacterium]